MEPTQVNIRNTECDSIFFIRKAERKHSGKYEMTVQVENHVDTAVLDIQIVGESSCSPAGILKVELERVRIRIRKKHCHTKRSILLDFPYYGNISKGIQP